MEAISVRILQHGLKIYSAHIISYVCIRACACTGPSNDRGSHTAALFLFRSAGSLYFCLPQYLRRSASTQSNSHISSSSSSSIAAEYSWCDDVRSDVCAPGASLCSAADCRLLVRRIDLVHHESYYSRDVGRTTGILLYLGHDA